MSKDTRNATTGETAIETADRMAGSGKTGNSNPVHPSAVPGPTKPVGPNVHPSAPGVYGAPIGDTILK